MTRPELACPLSSVCISHNYCASKKSLLGNGQHMTLKGIREHLENIDSEVPPELLFARASTWCFLNQLRGMERAAEDLLRDDDLHPNDRRNIELSLSRLTNETIANASGEV